MIKSQIILILSLLWIGSSLAKSMQPYEEDYDYSEVARMFPRVYRGRNDADAEQQQRPSIQNFWQSFVRNIPFRFNMTSSIGNLFNAGTQQILEAPVGVHQQQDVEPNRRRRKSPKRKSSLKRSKARRSNMRDHSNYYNYAYGGGNYRQLQLQPIGMDEANVMHFYDPNTGSYYALQLLSSPGHYYSPTQMAAYDSDEEDDDDSYYGEDNNDQLLGDDQDHGVHEDSEDPIAEADHEYDDGHQHGDYDNDDYNGIAEAAAEPTNDYADDIQIVDNWGYTDEDIFGERKLKGSAKPFALKSTDEAKLQAIKTKLPPRIVTLQKHMLKPENEEDVKILLSAHKQTQQASDGETRKPSQKRIKPTSSEKTPQDADSESVRNVLGSFMKDDSMNRRRQSTAAKTTKRQRFVERPRQRERYFIYPHFY